MVRSAALGLALAAVALVGVAGAAAPAGQPTGASAHAYALRILVPGQAANVQAEASAPPEGAGFAQSFQLPADGTIVKTGGLTKLADVAPWLKENQLAPVKPIEYTSRDGLTIHGYLTLPLDARAAHVAL